MERLTRGFPPEESGGQAGVQMLAITCEPRRRRINRVRLHVLRYVRIEINSLHVAGPALRQVTALYLSPGF